MFDFFYPENHNQDTNFWSGITYTTRYSHILQDIAKPGGHLVGHLVGHLGFLHCCLKEIIYNVIFGFLDPKNLYLDTNFMSLSQLLTKL